MFDQFLDLVAQPPGSLIYHFIILFAVEAALAISFGQWMRDREEGSARLTVAIFALFLTRVFLLVASLLAWRGLLPRNVLLPPVERMADTTTVLALLWAFVTMDDPQLLRRNFVPDVFAVASMAVIIVSFIGTYYFWFSSAGDVLFNGLLIDRAWAIGQLLLAGVGLVWLLGRMRYAYDVPLKGIMLILLGAGASLHLLRPALGDVSAAMRVGQVIVIPMLAAVTYRHVVERLLHWDEFEPSAVLAPPLEILPERTPPPMPAVPDQPSPAPAGARPAPALTPPEGSADETVGAPPPLRPRPTISDARMLEVVEALGGLLSTLDTEGIVREAPRSVATALRADICLLAIVDESMEQAAIVGGYDNIAQTYLPETILDLADHPTMVNALGRLRQMRLTHPRNSRELRDLYDRVEITHLGPAYLQPLVRGEERIGLLVVGSPYSERQLTDDERNLLDRFGPLVTASLTNVEAHADMRDEQDAMLAEESSRLVSASDELTARTAELEEARRQIEEMRAYVRDAYRRAEEVDGLRKEYEGLKVAAAEASALRDERDRLLERLEGAAALERECENLREQIARLEQQAASMERAGKAALAASPADRVLLEQQLDDARLAAQTEIAALRVRLAQASISQQEVAFLQEQLAAKAREVITVQTRLTEAQAVAEALKEQVNHALGGSRELGVLQARVAAQASEIADLQARLAEARAEAALGEDARQMQQDLDESDRAAMSNLQAQLLERSELIEALQTRLAEKARAVAELRLQMNDVETSMRNVEQQLASKTEEVESLQRSLADARAQAQARIDALVQQVETGQGDAAAVERARIEALQAELEEKSAALTSLEQQLERTRTAMADLEEQLATTNRAVDAAVAGSHDIDQHDEVIASMAQELRTPMSSIVGYTDVLLGEQVGILGSLQRKFLQRVKSNTERMGALLDDLIRITALDKGRLRLEPEKVDVAFAVEEVIANLTDQYREKELTLRMVIGEEIPPVNADRDALTQIISHLLANAALASPVKGEVELLAASQHGALPGPDGEDHEEQCLYLQVRDSGSGVDPADFDRVFARKYRADNPLIEGLGDTGVGLSLTKALVETHGGRIWMESEKDLGTTFHVLIPFSPPHGVQGDFA